MGIRIKLKFPELGKPLEDFIKSLTTGALAIPVSKQYDPGKELELALSFPLMAEPHSVLARVKSQDPAKKIMQLTVDEKSVSALLSVLAPIPAYQNLLKQLNQPSGTAESRDEGEQHLAEEYQPRVKVKSVPPKPEPKRDKNFDAPDVEVTIMRVEPEKAEPKKKEPPQEEPRKAEPKEEEPSKEEAKPGKKKEENPEEEKGSSPDVMFQLKDWLLIKSERQKAEEEEKKKKKKKKKKGFETDYNEDRRDLDLNELAAADKFSQSLVKAMLRSGYYAPDHPESGHAKQGLYDEFIAAVGAANELGFMMQHKVGVGTEILVTGISDEPVFLKKLLGPGTADLFFPKYMDYFERKRLVNLTIKKTIPEGPFNRFIDIMSDPAVDSGKSTDSGRLLTRMLVESKITDISAVFEDDLISIETELPWRVEMGMQRLAKDLKVLPMFKGLSEAEMHRVKQQIVQDILRPLRQPQLLKDIVLNAYLIGQQVPEINEEELEEAIIDNFPLHMLLPTSELIFAEFHKLVGTKTANAREEDVVRNRIYAVRRILKRIAVRVMDAELPGSEKFLEDLFTKEIVKFDDLPDAVKEMINMRKMTMEFQKQPSYWLGKFSEAHRKVDLDIFMKFFNKITSGLIEAHDWTKLYLLTDTLARIPPQKVKALAELGIENAMQSVWGDSAKLLASNILTETGETRKGLEQIILLLGEVGLQAVYRALLEEESQNKRKLLIESLVKFGPQAMELFRAILSDPAKPPYLHVLSLETVSRARKKEDADLVKLYLKHSRPEVRAEAITACVRTLGWEAWPLLAPMLADPDPAVIKRLMAAVGGYAAKHDEAKAALIESAIDRELSNEIRAQCLQELSRARPENLEMRQQLQQELIKMVEEGEGFRKRLRSALGAMSKDEERVKLAALDLLGKIGDQETLNILSKTKISGKESSNKLTEVLNQLHLRWDGKE